MTLIKRTVRSSLKKPISIKFSYKRMKRKLLENICGKPTNVVFSDDNVDDAGRNSEKVEQIPNVFKISTLIKKKKDSTFKVGH